MSRVVDFIYIHIHINIDWPPSYVHYHPIIPCSITSINIFLYELPLFFGSEYSQTQPSEDVVCFSDKNLSLTTGASLIKTVPRLFLNNYVTSAERI